MINNYAKLIIKQGVNLQQDQELLIQGSVECKDLIRELVKEAYLIGAKDVVVNYLDDVISKLKYENRPVEQFETVPSYIPELFNEYAKRGAAVITITSSDPEAMKGIDPKKISTSRVAQRKACDVFYDALDAGVNRWCVVAAPSLGWANKVFPDVSDDEAVEMLWQAIFKATRADQKDPIDAWDKHHESFEEKVNILNTSDIDYLHFTNEKGTDLKVGLVENYLFAGGASYTTDGIRNFANIPTEEVFAAPHKYKVNGIVYSSLPLNHNGCLVEDFTIEFKDGKIVNYDAKVGKEVLTSIIDTDEGASYLGEVALVPYHSTISEMGVLFYNTLFDENASCHLAIGKGYAECIENGLNMSREELEAVGVNDSLTHVDFMFGTPDLKVVAYLKDGTTKDVFIDGDFAF